MVVRERRDVTDNGRGKLAVGGRRDFTDSARGKVVVRELRDINDSARGMWSLGRDGVFESAGESGRTGET